MIKKYTVFFVVQTGFAIRNVLRSDAFRALAKKKDLNLVIFCGLSQNKKFQKEFCGSNIFFEKLHSNQDMSVFEWYSKNLQSLSQAYRKPTESYDIILKKLKKTNLLKYRLAKILKPLLMSDKIFRGINCMDTRLFGNKNYDRLIEKYNPDLIFFSGAYDFDSHPLARRAKVMDIPSITLITSWDNLTKGSLIVKPDEMIVWNNIMKKEAIKLHGMKPEDVHVVGAPPFDFYHNVKILSREDFFKKMGLDQKKKLIVYASVTRSVTKDESFIVRDLLEMIDNRQLVEGCQILARIYARRNINEYKKYFNRSNIIFDQPKIVKNLPDLWNPDKNTMEHIANTLAHADVFVSSSTTMVIEAALFDTPIVNWMYDEIANKDYTDSVSRFFDYTHYKNIIETKGVQVAKSPEEMKNQINTYLKSPHSDKKGRERIIKEQIGTVDGLAGKRISEVIYRYLKKK
jgi:predicted glycosyltransferase